MWRVWVDCSIRRPRPSTQKLMTWLCWIQSWQKGRKAALRRLSLSYEGYEQCEEVQEKKKPTGKECKKREPSPPSDEDNSSGPEEDDDLSSEDAEDYDRDQRQYNEDRRRWQENA